MWPCDVSCHILSKVWAGHRQHFSGFGWRYLGQGTNSVLDTSDRVFSLQQWVPRKGPKAHYFEYTLGRCQQRLKIRVAQTR